MSQPLLHRIAKLLARAGIASRREVERMIADGRVALNGAAINTPATLLASLAGVTVDGVAVEEPSAARLFLYHKPVGLLVTERDPGGRLTIYDRLPPDLPRVVPVGRLDLNTEGLLLLTNDGGLKRQLELPATGVERAYRARAYGAVTQAQLEDLIEGVEIEGVRYGAIDANLERRTGANVWIELVLKEGKNREVRRVLEHLGLKVSRLIRTRYGPFVLGDLRPGAVGEVRAHDVASFAKNPDRLDLPQPARVRDTAVRPVVARREPERSASRAAPVKPRIPRATIERPAKGPAGGRGKPKAAPSSGQAQSGRPLRRRADGSVAVPTKAARDARRGASGDAASPARPPGARPAGKPGARPPRPRR
ncbi:pseudouridine synthase [uncultured Sphingomonas sp.]|uniref:pseudouridine synthase n=1 Tax=uncultured Sphingomonas sp. TaxID=158754 RepID=UPI0035CA7987